MEKSHILEEKDNIKNFTLNLKIDNYNEFINYIFSVLNKEVIDDIIFYTLLYKKYSEYIPDIKNGNLDKIYNMYKILLNKLEYDKLNIKERYIYEYITAFLILSSEFENNKLFEKYCDIYLTNINYNNFNKQIFLIHQNIVNKLNKEYNKKFKVSLHKQKNSVAATNWLDKEKKDKIYLNSNMYLTYFYNKCEHNIDIPLTLAIEIFTILHEYKHLLQKDYLFSNSDNISNNYKNDLYIICKKNKKLYENYHNNILIEKEANKFAFENTYYYLKNYIKNSYLYWYEIEKILYKNYNINPKDNKRFLLQYKIIKYYLEISESLPIETKRLKIFNKIIEERKEEYKLKKT